ncbi:Imm59 family immunity protein [Listeria aquatica]|uniref:Imm59 family immunity protein n=1 Tax=Listeria aquatica TaxID=1494960 RepID=UPI003EF3164B
MKSLEKKAMKINQKIIELGFESLRVSVFNAPDKKRVEYQTRIEFDEVSQKYQVYSLADRASIMGRVKEFSDFENAQNDFLKKLRLTVEYNKLRVSRNEPPEYPCPLWDKNI